MIVLIGILLGTMPTLLSGIANGARHGILFKNGAQLEMSGRVKAITFDKTPTWLAISLCL